MHPPRQQPANPLACDTANVRHTHFTHLVERFEGQTVVLDGLCWTIIRAVVRAVALGDKGFHNTKGNRPTSSSLAGKEWNERMTVWTQTQQTRAEVRFPSLVQLSNFQLAPMDITNG